ncbi:MAG: permease [Bacteroidetes bacterium]|nr:MAG: permease [Bacteroidota bacterium]
MKILDKLIIKSFIGPSIMTFFIVLFVLDMQFLWKYVDDLVGKGLEWYVIVELLFYATAIVVPMALPLSILLSSLMMFGNLGEHYELVACKAAGISLQRVFLSLMITVTFISVGAFGFSNYVMPFANLKFWSLMHDVRSHKPAFSIKEGVFYNGIDNYSLKVEKKESDGKTLNGIMIYDHTDGRENRKVLIAKKGVMEMTDDGMMLTLKLYDGYQYEEMKEPNKKNKVYPHFRMKFEEYEISFDMAAFALKRSDEALFKDKYQMLNLTQLNAATDTLKKKLQTHIKGHNSRILGNYHFEDVSTYSMQPVDSLYAGSFIDKFPIKDQKRTIKRATKTVRNVKSMAERAFKQQKQKVKYIIRHEVEWHRKFTLSAACLVLFFVGAPLGAIIRVGGLGLPVVVSILLFIFFYVISITGEKFAKDASISEFAGMWISIFVLLPIGVFLTRQATSETSFMDLNSYVNFVRKIFFLDKIEKFFDKEKRE